MRRLFLISVLTLTSTLFFAQGIEFFEGDYKEAFANANKRDQLVFVDAYAVWCGPCKRMSKQIFPQEEVGAFFNSNFVNMKIDMEKGQGLEFRKKYPVTAFPTFFFIDGEGNVVYKFKGARDAAGLINEAKKAIESFDGSAKYATLYEEGDRSYETVFKYIRTLNRAGKSSLKVANDYLLAQENIETEDNLRLIYEACTEVDSRIFDLMVEKEANMISLFGEEAFSEKVLAAADATFDKSIEFGVEDLEKQALKAVKKYAKPHYKNFLYSCEMQKAEREQDGTTYVKNAAKYYKTISGDVKSELNLVTDLMEGFGNDTDALKLALKISENVATDAPSAENYVLVSKIHSKLNQNQKAKEWAQMALEIASDDPMMKSAVQRYMNTLEMH